MARRLTIYVLVLAMVFLYFISRYMSRPDTDLVPHEVISRSDIAIETHTRKTTIVAPSTGSSIDPCQLERQLFMRKEELSKFSVPIPPKNLPPSKLNITESSSLVDLLELVKVFLDRNNISYVLGFHSLLGSYVMHNILPYDDKIQLLAKVSHKQILSKAISKDDKLTITEHSTGKDSYKYVRLFKKTSRQTKHPWPLVELHYYDENSTHVWTTMPHPERVVVERTAFYPFHDRPMARLWLPAQRDPRKFLLQVYSTRQYQSFGWDHRSDVAEEPTNIRWHVMAVKYPFVARTNCGEGVKETLKFQRVDQYTVYIDEYFPYKEWVEALG